MKVLSRIMGAFTGEYLFKSYLISALILFIIYKGEVYTETSHQVYMIFCAVLYPFATIVWDEIIHALTNGTTLVFTGWGIILSFAWKILKCFLLFLFTPVIAPFGIIYLLFLTRRREN